jgi:hypothetical protein
MPNLGLTKYLKIILAIMLKTFFVTKKCRYGNFFATIRHPNFKDDYNNFIKSFFKYPTSTVKKILQTFYIQYDESDTIVIFATFLK